MSRRGYNTAVLILACCIWARLAPSSSVFGEDTAVKVPIQVEGCKVNNGKIMANLNFQDENGNPIANLDIGEGETKLWMELRRSGMNHGQNTTSLTVNMPRGCFNLTIDVLNEKELILSYEDSRLFTLSASHAASVRVTLKQEGGFTMTQVDVKATQKTPNEKIEYVKATQKTPNAKDPQVLPPIDVVVVLVAEVVLVGVAVVVSVMVLVLTIRM